MYRTRELFAAHRLRFSRALPVPKSITAPVHFASMMSVRKRSETWAKAHPRAITAVLSIVGYTLVAASFLGLVPFPTLGRQGVVLLSDTIAVINSIALLSLLAGVRFIKRGQRRRHAAAMGGAAALIVIFLVLYVWKQAGGFTKGFVVAEGQLFAQYATAITFGYWLMLGVHVFLSVVAVPVVIHALVLGATQPMDQLGETLHPVVGRIAVAAWGLSLALGILTYWLLNHVYGWEPIQEAFLMLFVASPWISTRPGEGDRSSGPET